MYYIGKIADSQVRVFIENEFSNFESMYPNVDFFAIDFSDIHDIQHKIENKKIVIHYSDNPPMDGGLDIFSKLFESNLDKTFYILNESPCWEDIRKWPNNVNWVHYNLVPLSHTPNNTFGDYKKISLLVNKNFGSEKIGISLNRLLRPSRLSSISYMLGIHLDDHCVITAPLLKWHLSQSNNNLDIMNTVNWNFTEYDEEFKDKMLIGFERAKKSDGIFPITKDAYPPYDILEPNQVTFDNISNYNNNLVQLYENSFVEYIHPNVFEYPIPWLCEKLLQSQLACNFPIFITGRGVVSWLRRQGFDPFDDIINHSYDEVESPTQRMQKLIHDNISLVTNKDSTKELWIKNNHRFQSNVDWVEKMHIDVLNKGRKVLHTWLSN